MLLTVGCWWAYNIYYYIRTYKNLGVKPLMYSIYGRTYLTKPCSIRWNFHHVFCSWVCGFTSATAPHCRWLHWLTMCPEFEDNSVWFLSCIINYPTIMLHFTSLPCEVELCTCAGKARQGQFSFDASSSSSCLQKEVAQKTKSNL